MAKTDAETAAESFVKIWSEVELSERSASQQHFIALCRLIGQPIPVEADPTGENYTFEKSVKVVGVASKGSKGEGGFVDVWKRGCFGWEYKRKDKYKSLDEAYRQLYQYRDALENPPLSVVCDIRTTEIRTHFTGYPLASQVIWLEEIPGKLANEAGEVPGWQHENRRLLDTDSGMMTMSSTDFTAGRCKQ